MKLPHRRLFLRLAAGAAAFPTVASFAWAEAYPTRPVRIIVGFPAGGSGDIVARLAGQWLSERLGQPFMIENRPGADTMMAAEVVVRAVPDGYTLLCFPAINASLYATLDFNFIRDITAVASIVSTPFLMVVNPSFPAKTVPEFIAYAKAHPGKINYASGGIGSLQQLAAELFKKMTGIGMIHVPYRGDGPALGGLIREEVQVYFGPIPSSIGYIRAGKLRALAVTTATRSEALPDTPTVGEFLSGYEVTNWLGIGVPKNTPTEIVDKLNKEINARLADAKVKERLAVLGGVPTPMSPAAFGKLIAEETENWAKVIKFADIRVE